MSRSEPELTYQGVPYQSQVNISSPYDTPFDPSLGYVLQPTDLPPPGFPQGDFVQPDEPVDMGLPPLVVDVYGGTPEALPSELPIYKGPFLPAPDLPPGFQIEPPVVAAAGGGGSMSNGFLPTGLDFPTLRDIVESFTGPGIISTQRQAPRQPILGGACPPGRVLQRRTVHVVSGRNICAKKRHMNVCNRHALGKATSRVKGFMHLAKRTEAHMRHAFGSLLKTHRAPARGGCRGCGARTRSSCIC